MKYISLTHSRPDHNWKKQKRKKKKEGNAYKNTNAGDYFLRPPRSLTCSWMTASGVTL